MNEIQGKVTGTFASKQVLAKDLLGAMEQMLTSEAVDDGQNIPITALPKEIQVLISELAQKYKFPPAFCLMSVLFAVSVSIGNKYKILFKKDWIDIAALYMCVVAPPGAMKTPVFKFFARPMIKRDKANHQNFLDEDARFELSKKAATKEHPCEDKPPTFKQLLVNDTTIEALVRVWQDNPNGVGFMVDELLGFFNNLNRYSKGGDVQKILSAYTGDQFSVNRVGGKPMYIKDAFLSMLGGIQTAVVASAFTPELMTNGMYDRYLFCLMNKAKKEIAGDEELTEGLYEKYESMVNFILDTDSETKYIHFNSDSKYILSVFRQKTADMLNDSNEAGNERLAGVLSKFDYHIIRLSLIMQVMDDAINSQRTTEIKPNAVNNAIQLCDYFMEQSGRVLEVISKNSLSGLPQDRKRLYELLPDLFKREEAIKIARTIKHSDRLNTVTGFVKRFLLTDYFTKMGDGGMYKKNKS